MSAVVASPMFSTKFACFSENRAPPTRRPRQPAASSSIPAERPSARGSSGFLKVDPKVLMPEGCASLRRVLIPASVALTVVRLGGRELEGRRGDDLPLPEVRAPVGEVEVGGDAAIGALGGADVDPLERSRELAAVGVRVHPHGAADAAGDVHPELEAGEAPAGRLGGGRGQAGAATAAHAVAMAFDLRKFTVQLQHESSKSVVRYEEIRSRAHHSYRGSQIRCEAEQLEELLLGARAGEHVGVCRRPGPSSAAPAGSRARGPRGRSTSPPCAQPRR